MREEDGGTAARTPEQHDAVRRRSLPLALGGAICGAAGLVMLVRGSAVNEVHPPGLLGVNLAFCAMMIGVGILFYARRTPGTGVAVALSVFSIVSGIAGPLVFARQSMQWRQAMEGRELGNVRAIAVAARAYASEHGGAFPADIALLMKLGKLKAEDAHSPFGSEESVTRRKKLSPAEYAEWYQTQSDYLYFGGDLRVAATQPAATGAAATATMPAELPHEIIVVCGADPIMRKWISVGYADGTADYLDLSGAEAALKASNEARARMGFAAIRPPESVRKAQELERRER